MKIKALIKPTGKKVIFVLGGIILFFVLMIGLVSVYLLRAPGCVDLSFGLSPGGCHGKSIIQGIKIEPNISCLSIISNNCNGGILEVENKCGQDLKIGNLNMSYIRIDEYEEDAKVKLVKNENEEVTVKVEGVNIDSNDWETLQDKIYDKISTTGKVGENTFNITVTKTNAQIKPHFECLNINFGFFSGVDQSILIKNKCDEEVSIGGVSIPYYLKKSYWPGGFYYVELVKNESGDVVVKELKGNFASYIPPKKEILSVVGFIGNQEFNLSYTKTKKLC